jgi:hypothetical protein
MAGKAERKAEDVKYEVRYIEGISTSHLLIVIIFKITSLGVKTDRQEMVFKRSNIRCTGEG